MWGIEIEQKTAENGRTYIHYTVIECNNINDCYALFHEEEDAEQYAMVFNQLELDTVNK